MVNLILLVTCFGLGLCEAKRLLARHPDLALESLHRKARYLAVIISAVPLAFAFIVIPLMNKTWLWHVPVWFDLYAVHISFGVVIGCFSFLFSLATAVARKTGHPEGKKMMVAGLFIVAAFPLFQYQYTRPVFPLLKDSRMMGVILQSHSATCAAASGANVVHVLGMSHTEKEMARRMGTSDMIGTNAGQIINAMDQVGVRCTKKWVEDSDASRIVPPALFFVDNEDLGPESHAVAFMGQRDGKWEIWDPLEGKQLFTSKQLKIFWSGKSLECSVPEQENLAKNS